MLAFANEVSVSAAFLVYVSAAIWLKICHRTQPPLFHGGFEVRL